MRKIIVSIIIIGMLLATVIPSTIGEVATNEKQTEPYGQISELPNLDFPFIPKYVPGEIIIKFKDSSSLQISGSSSGIVTTGIASVDEINLKYKVASAEKLLKQESVPLLSNVYIFSFSTDESVYSAVGDFEKDNNVEYAEPNYIYHLCAEKQGQDIINPNTIIPNDPYFDVQWPLNNIGQDYPSDGRFTHPGTPDCDIDAPEAWGIETGDDDVVVAVIDTGVDYTHPDIKENIWINTEEDINHNGKFDNWPKWLGGDLDGKDNDENGFIDDVIGWNFGGSIGLGISDNNNPMDKFGHGTHCAGIIGAVGNNNIGISGICWSCKIMPIKLGYPLLQEKSIIRGIIYAADNGADVMSMSFGGSFYSELLYDAIDYAYNKGVVIVAAAGNEGTDSPLFPAAFDNVIAVAATDSKDQKTNFSNYGSWVDVAAPGVDILSLRAKDTDMYGDGTHIVDGNYYISCGTSMACPHVAGLAALLLSKNECPSMVETLITNTADPVSSTDYIGSGRINAYNALQRKPAVAILNNPSDWTDVKGVVEITGTAWGEVFQYYTVSYGKSKEPESWTEIANSTLIVQDGVLAMLDTNGLDDGLYIVKLLVTCSDGVYEDTIQIVVNNEENTIHVDDDNVNGPWDGTVEHPFKNIQDGVDEAGKKDTIYVHNGNRYYGKVLIYKSVNLIGENKDTTNIVGNVYVRSRGISVGVTISGFTIQCGSVRAAASTIFLGTSSGNCINGNNIKEGYIGIYIVGASDSCISENNITDIRGIHDDGVGILGQLSYNNKIYHNNFIDNSRNAQDWGNDDWDDGSEGNYWDDYKGFDILPPYGIGDTPYFIFPYITGNRDRHPLMKPYENGADNNPSVQNNQQQSSPTSQTQPSSQPSTQPSGTTTQSTAGSTTTGSQPSSTTIQQSVSTTPASTPVTTTTTATSTATTSR